MFLFLLLSLFGLSESTSNGGGVIEGSVRFPNGIPITNTTIRLELNHGEMITYSKTDGNFVFYQVPPGVHLVDAYSHQFHFPQMKVQLLDDTMTTTTTTTNNIPMEQQQQQSPKCIEYAYPGAPKVVTKYPLEFHAQGQYVYFTPKPRFSVMSIVQNPMILMMLVMVGMMFAMPKMMENLEPEERERMQRQMAAQQDPTKMLSSLWEDLSGTAATPTTTKTPTISSSKTSKKMKKG
jgi:ER membrane protein complex subunit 7